MDGYRTEERDVKEVGGIECQNRWEGRWMRFCTGLDWTGLVWSGSFCVCGTER